MKTLLKDLLACLLVALPLYAAEVRLDGVAASVNEAVITVGEVFSAMDSQRRQMEARFSGEELKARLAKVYRETLDMLVERRLILNAYEKQKMKIPDSMVDRRINEIISERFDNDRSALLADLAADRLTFDEWRTKVREQISVGAMRHEFVDRYVNVSPAAVRKFYDTNPDRFSAPGKIHLRMIVIEKGGTAESAAAKRSVADGAVKRLRAGEEFAAVAKAASEDNKAAEGGDWGWVEPKLLQAKLVEVAKKLQPREFSEPVETDSSFYILQCEGRQDSTPTPFEDVRATIEKDMESAESERLYNAWIGRLKADAYVKLKDESPL